MDLFRACFQHSPDAIALLRADAGFQNFTYLAVNDSFLRDTGYALNELIGNPIGSRIPEPQAQVLMSHFIRCHQQKAPVEFEHQFNTPTGQRTWHVRIALSPDAPNSDIFMLYARDITWTRDFAQRLNSIADYLPGFVYQLAHTPDGQWRYLFVGKRVEEFFGVTVEQAMHDAHTLIDRIHPDDAERVMNTSFETASRQQPWSCEFRMLRADGSELWVQANDLPQNLADGTIIWTGYVNDITEKKALEASLKASEERYRTMARFDSLTGLLNRSEFMFQLQQIFQRVSGHGGTLALLFLDLDHFKPVNDNHGHATGDALLQLVAKRLQSLLRAVDLVARIGGDEFTVMLDRVSDSAEAEKIGRKILEAMAQPFVLGKLTFHVSASIGIAMGPMRDESVHDLINAADHAMYQAKAQGRNRVVVATRPGLQKPEVA